MAILEKPREEDAHWYTADGKPMHRMPMGDGADRPTTVRDARKHHLFPSVTSILSIFAKEGLNKWKISQVAEAAMKIRPNPKESPKSYAERVTDAAFEQVNQAANFGSYIHRVLESALSGETIDQEATISLPNVDHPVRIMELAQPVLDWIEAKGLHIMERELTLVNTEFGFGGTMDTAFTFGKGSFGVLDFKTRKTEPGKPIKAYEFQPAQIIAYGATYWSKKLGWPIEKVLSKMHGANIFISSTEPGRVEIIRYTPELLRQEWDVVQVAAIMWRYINGYDPRDNPFGPPDRREGETIAVSPYGLPAQAEALELVPTPSEPSEVVPDAETTPPVGATSEKIKGLRQPKAKPATSIAAGVKDAKVIVAPASAAALKRAAGYKIDFGKHTGKSLSEVPEEYRVWLATQKARLISDKALAEALALFGS